MEEWTSSFTDDTDTHCDYSISDHTSDTDNVNDTHTDFVPKIPNHSLTKKTYIQRHLWQRTHAIS